MDFIFMLTNHDATVPDAVDVYESIRSTGLRMVGFKDVGAAPDTLRRLTDTMHEDSRTVFLEVVSTSIDDELRSIEVGLGLGVDVIMGGTNHEAAIALIGGAPVRYFPFPGTVVGHPSELHGSIEEIASHAAELTSLPSGGGPGPARLPAPDGRSARPHAGGGDGLQWSGGGGRLDRPCRAHPGGGRGGCLGFHDWWRHFRRCAARCSRPRRSDRVDPAAMRMRATITGRLQPSLD